MTTVTSYTAARMAAIEAQAIVGGIVTGDNLILRRYNNTTFSAGNVRGLPGPQGTPGQVTTADMVSAIGVETADRAAADTAVKSLTGLGVVAHTEVTANQTIVANGGGERHDISGGVTFTPVTNRYYRISATIHVRITFASQPHSPTRVFFEMVDASEFSITNGAVWMGQYTADTPVHLSRIFKAPSGWTGSKSLKLRHYSDDAYTLTFPNAAGGMAYNLTVEDLGTGP